MSTNKIKFIHLEGDGTFPNSVLPVMFYEKVLKLPSILTTFQVKRYLRNNGWFNAWRSGIFTFHHYHSITHEVLAIIDGETSLQLGGAHGQVIRVKKGDVIVIPAGVAHKNLGDENQVTCIGAYPEGRDYDINYGIAGERPAADTNIAHLALPEKDPVFGGAKGIVRFWRKAQRNADRLSGEKEKTGLPAAG